VKQTLNLYWNTLRYLKPTQVRARARHTLLPAPLARPRRLPSPFPRMQKHPFLPALKRQPSMLARDRFLFLNEEGTLSSAADWNNPAKAKLWLYNLHYFDDLSAPHAHERATWHRALIGQWIAENSPGVGVGWEAYPSSLRIVNWVKWSLAGNPLTHDAHSSLYLQAQTLARRLEWHLLGNHILANAKALIFAGLYFSGSGADALVTLGQQIYRDQLGEQILRDGGHFELSPMYHSILLEDVLDLLNIDEAYGHPLSGAFRRTLRDTAADMRRWLQAMVHPDGEIAFFNDAAFGIAASPSDIEGYADRLNLPASPAQSQRLPHRLEHLARSGYLRLENADAVALLDCAPIGPDYLPGHAHADTLSFEFSLGNERVIVNGGTSVYEDGPTRHRQRSTSAHSTVVVDDENSSEVWRAFRVARRARIIHLDVQQPPKLEVTASHDGYERLAGRNVHTRSWMLDDHRLTVTDHVSGPYASAVALFHFAPNVRVHARNQALSGRLTTGKDRNVTWRASSQTTSCASTWHPEFGVSIPATCLAVPLIEGRSQFTLEW